jgi:3-isopropylmalate/(R)-2-methylmalate dehydratase small subunit
MDKGKAHVYGDHVDTDRLFPGRYLHCVTPEEIQQYALEDLDPEFRERVEPGDIVFGGKQFGCGSSREQAVSCLYYVGVRSIVAESFARIYYRNCVNNGVAPVICPPMVAITETGDEVSIDLACGTVTNHTKEITHTFEPLPGFLREILDAGGLVAHLRRRYATPQEVTQ